MDFELRQQADRLNEGKTRRWAQLLLAFRANPSVHSTTIASAMAYAVRFGDSNYGFQAGIIKGSVDAHLPPGKLQWPRPTALTTAPPQNDQKLHRIRRSLYLSVATLTLSSGGPYSNRSTKNALRRGLGLRSWGWAALGKHKPVCCCGSLTLQSKSQLAIEYAHQVRDRSPDT